MKYSVISALALGMVLSACTNPTNLNTVDKANSVGVYDGNITPLDNPISHTTVMIYGKTGSGAFGCTGSVLSPTVILTASHCVTDVSDNSKAPPPLDPKNIVIVDPAKVGSGQSPILSRIEKIVANPKFLAQAGGWNYSRFAEGYDVALMKLATPLPAYYKSVHISDNVDELFKQQIAIAGFGAHSNDEKQKDDMKLRDGPVRVQSAENGVYLDFPKSDKHGNVTSVNMLAFIANKAYAPTIVFKKAAQDASICHGDSGGPIYYEKNGEIYLVGVNVSFIDPKQTNASCVTNQTETSISLSGPQLTFVLETFKQLNGSAYPGLQRNAAENDPNSFDFYLKSPVEKSKNTLVDLSTIAVVRNDADGSVALIGKSSAATVCANQQNIEASNLLLYMSKATDKLFDGKTVLSFMAGGANGPIGYVEGRMKAQGDKVRTVVLTPQGYLSADVPLVTCNFKK